MKKPRTAFVPGSVSTFNEVEEQQAARDLFRQQATQQQPEIVLNLGNGKEATFRLMRIKAADIKKKTKVFRGNARIQKSLNAFTLRDILPSIRLNGMTFPAIGFLHPDGTIEVWDGSRRRESCIIAGQDYFVYVTDSPLINEAVAEYLSDIGNKHKPLSLYELGAFYTTLLNEEGYNVARLMAEHNVSKAKVYQARDAYALPEAFYHAHASSFDIGRPRINTYRKLLKEAREGGFESEFLEFVETLDPDELSKSLDAKPLALSQVIAEASPSDEERFSHLLECSNLAELMKHPGDVEQLGVADAIIRLVDKAAATEIKEAFDSLKPETKQKKPVTRTLFKGSKVTVTSSPTKNGMKLEFKKVSEAQQQVISQLIADYLAGQESNSEG